MSVDAPGDFSTALARKDEYEQAVHELVGRADALYGLWERLDPSAKMLLRPPSIVLSVALRGNPDVAEVEKWIL